MKERNSQTGIALELYIRVCLITPQQRPARQQSFPYLCWFQEVLVNYL